MDIRTKEKTIDTLLSCGLELFGKYGYDSVTTRHISEYTGLNSALIAYYFGNKKAYYHEVISYVTDLLLAHFSKVDFRDLESKDVAQLEAKIKEVIDCFYAWFTSVNGAGGTNLFFRELISQQHPEAKKDFARAVDFITPYFIKLFSIYYEKTERSHINPTFIWILLISITQNVSLHSNAPEVAKQAFEAAQIPQNMLDLIIKMH